MNLNFVVDKILYNNNILLSDISDMVSKFNCYDYGDIFFQDGYKEYLLLENNKLKNNFFEYIKGVGVRLNKSDKTFFSYTNNINKNSIFNLIKKLIFLNNNNILSKNKKIFILHNKIINKVNYSLNFNLNKKKIDILFKLYNYIKKIDNRINFISLSLLWKYDLILISNTDYEITYDIRPLINLSIKVQIENNYNKEIGISGGGGCYCFSNLLKKKKNNIFLIYYWANEAVRIAINNLNAKNAPVGSMPVILSSGSPGILLHEAIGHGLEADFNRRGTSLFFNCLNKKVASSNCTIIDSNNIKEKIGSSSIDDEGIKCQERILIKNGFLISYLFDRLNSRLMNFNSNGCGRRESYSHLPIPRMSNTYLLPGIYKFNDIINSVDYGIYIVNLLGGQVDITSGNFVFTTLEGYLIKNGKILYPIKSATLIGSSFDIMNKISMIGNDLFFDDGMGFCGKDNQSVPVSVGQPTLKIDSMTIGGLN